MKSNTTRELTIMVTTLSRDNQYSVCTLVSLAFIRPAGQRSHLSINLDRAKVQTKNEDKAYEANGPAREIISPVLYQDLKCYYVRGNGHRVVSPVVPGQGESERVVHKAAESIRKTQTLR
jgi:hypothetical protein